MQLAFFVQPPGQCFHTRFFVDGYQNGSHQETGTAADLNRSDDFNDVRMTEFFEDFRFGSDAIIAVWIDGDLENVLFILMLDAQTNARRTLAQSMQNPKAAWQ